MMPLPAFLPTHRFSNFSNCISGKLLNRIVALTVLATCASALHAATSPSVITLSLSSSSVSSGSAVKLTASVTSNGTAVTSGRVAFCDATFNAYCEDGARIGVAQVTTNGTASITRILSPGTHQLYVEYCGTTTYAESTSQNSKQSLTVNPKASPSVSLNISGSSGNYSFTSTVTGHSAAPLTGSITFQNAANNQNLSTATLGSPSISQSFSAQGTYPTGTSPIAAAAGDFNNDGHMDLVVANNNDASVSVFLADPSNPGTFQSQVKYTISGLPYAIALADFNSDGILDMAVANSTYLSILLGDPANPGTFQPEVTYSIGRGLRAIGVGDFNGDGLPDLAITDLTYSYLVHIALNDSTQPGHFLNSQTISTSYGTVAVASRDLNGDGLSDLILASSSNDCINVLLADPANPGKFLTAVSYPTYYEPTGISVADFNGDGVADVAAIEQSNIIDLFLGDPAHPGQFQSPKETTTNNLSYSSSAAADLNGDGLTDLALITNGSSNVNVLLADAKNPGQFQPQVNYSVGSSSSVFLTSADFNADGVPDIAVLDSSNSSVHFMQGAITETASATASISSSSLSEAAAVYSGNGTYVGAGSCVLSLSSLNPTAPVISNLQVTGITSNSATIQWTTNIPTNGMVQYGTTPTPAQYSPWVSLPTTAHSVVLSGLQPGTTYNYEVHVVAFSNGCGHWSAASPMNSFNTNP